MLNCSGVCAFCPNPCNRGVTIIEEERGKEEKISPITPEEEKGAEEAFDSFTSQEPEIEVKSSEVAVIENAGQYEVVRNIFGKEKVRKVK